MKVILFDTETTGVDPAVDQIIEAAWLEMPPTPAEVHLTPNAKAFPFYHERFNPTIPIGLGAQAVHHILKGDLGGCLEPDQFSIPHDVDYLIGHNIDFDWRMAGEPLIHRICTLAISRYLFPEQDSHTQSAMLYMVGRLSGKEARIRELLRGAHAALDDVRNCSILLRFLLAQAAEKGHAVNTWQEVHALSNIARIPTVMGFGKHKGDPIESVPASYVKWYRGQAETDPYYLAAFNRAGF